MDTCPKCHRKLLVHSSRTCNWCGCVIDDSAYQDSAAQKRDEFFTEDRLEQAAEVSYIDALSPTPGYHISGTFLQETVFPVRDPEVPANAAPDIEQPAPSEIMPTSTPAGNADKAEKPIGPL